MDDQIQQTSVPPEPNTNSPLDYPTEPKKKVNKKLVISLLGVMVLLGGVAYGVYVWQNSNLQQQKADSEKQLSALREELGKAKSDNPANQTPDNNGESPSLESSAVVVYIPDTFTQEEKANLDKKVVKPYLDHKEQYKGQESYNPVVSLTLTKKTSGSYKYEINAIWKSGGYEGFLYGGNGVIDWWTPDCFDGNCGLTEQFQQEYPEIVAIIKARGNTP